MSLCGRRQCGGDTGRAATATWTKAGRAWFGAGWAEVGDSEQTTRGMGGCPRSGPRARCRES